MFPVNEQESIKIFTVENGIRSFFDVGAAPRRDYVHGWSVDRAEHREMRGDNLVSLGVVRHEYIH
jgi:hypothetical protein